MSLDKQQKIYSIQMLRGIAALLVLAFHLGGYIKQVYKIEVLNSIFEFGYSGVDFFFVLSGFIITYSAHSSLDNPRKVTGFLFKRIFRVLPIYWIIISPLFIVTFILPVLVNSKYDFTFSNLIETYFVLPTHPKIIIVSWTLSHELFFYVLFSLLIVSRKLIFIPILVLIISILNWIFIPDFIGNSVLKFFFSPLNFEFALGIVAFYCYKKIQLNVTISYFLLIFGVIAFIIPFQFFEVNDFNRVLFFGLPSFLILLSILLLETNNAIGSLGLLDTIGDASYMIYLIHYPLISVLNKLAVKSGVTLYLNPLVLNLFLFAFITLIGIVLYRKIEKPLLKVLYGLMNGKRILDKAF